jgi:membrane fusion protein, copper/silver efflux system
MKKSFILSLSLVIIVNMLSLGQTQNQVSKSKNDKKCEMKCCDDPGMGSTQGKCRLELGEVIKSSMKMKDAFVSSDAILVSSTAGEVLGNLDKIDKSGMQGQEHDDCMKLLNSMSENLNNIKAAMDIHTQRAAYAAYNESLYQSIKHFGFTGEKLFYDFCPMALNSKGAYWLSNTEEIRNPYFGDKMLGCGKVKEILD